MTGPKDWILTGSGTCSVLSHGHYRSDTHHTLGEANSTALLGSFVLIAIIFLNQNAFGKKHP